MSRRAGAKKARTLKVSEDGVARRQTYPTGTVEQIRASLPSPVRYITPHGPDLEDGDDPAISALRPLPQFADHQVEQAITFIKSTNINPWLDDLIDASKRKTGRPRRTSVTAVLVAMWLCAQDGRGMLITQFRDVLFHQISPAMQARLGVLSTTIPHDRQEALRWNEAAEISVRRTLHRFLAQINPSPYRPNRKSTWPEIHAAARDLTDDQIATLQGRLDWVCNQMLDTAFKHLPQKVRRKYRGSACIDGTPLLVFSRGVSTTKGSEDSSADPDAGWYVRYGNHADPALAEDGTPVRDAKFKRRRNRMYWAFDLTLMVAADDRPGPRQYMPALPIAVTSDAAAVGPADCARRVIASVAQRGYKPGYLAGDNLYTNAMPEKFQIPARQAGYSLVLPYSRSTLGVTQSHASGMKMVEGGYHCPGLPEDLASATSDFLDKKIDHATYRLRITERNLYRMRSKQVPTNGLGERLTCPAAGPAPLAICALKPSSLKPRPTLQPKDGVVADGRPTITLAQRYTDVGKPRVCRQESVTVNPTDGAKHRQNIPYGTEKHSALYNTLRQSQEGLHGFVKDEGHEGLGIPARRRVRGKQHKLSLQHSCWPQHPCAKSAHS